MGRLILLVITTAAVLAAGCQQRPVPMPAAVVRWATIPRPPIDDVRYDCPASTACYALGREPNRSIGVLMRWDGTSCEPGTDRVVQHPHLGADLLPDHGGVLHRRP